MSFKLIFLLRLLSNGSIVSHHHVCIAYNIHNIYIDIDIIKCTSSFIARIGFSACVGVHCHAHIQACTHWRWTSASVLCCCYSILHCLSLLLAQFYSSVSWLCIDGSLTHSYLRCFALAWLDFRLFLTLGPFKYTSTYEYVCVCVLLTRHDALCSAYRFDSIEFLYWKQRTYYNIFVEERIEPWQQHKRMKGIEETIHIECTHISTTVNAA